jgi:hypothetical protein
MSGVDGGKVYVYGSGVVSRRAVVVIFVVVSPVPRFRKRNTERGRGTGYEV